MKNQTIQNESTGTNNMSNNLTQLDWDLDDALTALKQAVKAKTKGENKDAVTHLNNAIYSIKEAIARLEKGEK